MNEISRGKEGSKFTDIWVVCARFLSMLRPLRAVCSSLSAAGESSYRVPRGNLLLF